MRPSKELLKEHRRLTKSVGNDATSFDNNQFQLCEETPMDFTDNDEYEEIEYPQFFFDIDVHSETSYFNLPSTNEEDPALYDNCSRTVTEFSMAFMAGCRQKNVTDAAANFFLGLFREFLPPSNKIPSSFEKIKKIVAKKSSNTLVKETFIFCSSCSKEICECNALQQSVLLIFDFKSQLNELFLS